MEGGPFTPAVVRNLEVATNRWLRKNVAREAIVLSFAPLGEGIFVGVYRVGKENIGELFNIFIYSQGKGNYEFRVGPSRGSVTVPQVEIKLLQAVVPSGVRKNR